ncbi:methyltransferase domain-containing protein [Candidatus Woesearchaeota archaeon]|nr:methyltransferase domain-containing protein [Candidatus Woesearchaeota archaeon]
MVSLKEALEGELTKKQLSLVPRSFDVVGDVLIFSEFPDGLKKKEKLIGETILRIMKHVKVVCKKTKFHSGVFRTKKVKIIAGEKRKTTLYKENGVRIGLNVETCYFSPRLSNERMRIAELVKKRESVLVMFSGVAPYPLVIAKNSSAKEVYGIEISPFAHKLAEDNIKLNKANNIKLFLGDVKKVIPKLKKKFDRVIMPLPKSAEDFLDIALKAVKKNGVIHFYDFLFEEDFDQAVDKIKKHCKKCEILGIVKCGQYSPRKFRICVDFKVLNK